MIWYCGTVVWWNQVCFPGKQSSVTTTDPTSTHRVCPTSSSRPLKNSGYTTWGTIPLHQLKQSRCVLFNDLFTVHLKEIYLVCTAQHINYTITPGLLLNVRFSDSPVKECNPEPHVELSSNKRRQNALVRARRSSPRYRHFPRLRTPNSATQLLRESPDGAQYRSSGTVCRDRECQGAAL